ncbi:MAG: phosphoribosylglycinamide formyltransferase [Lachnospiraceae bacterium]|nr:phosphoribosylglycinamide formyltransferase [Lachnospiraceae bacterium]
MNIAIFASHGGTDMQAIVDGCKQGKINADVKILICNNPDAYVIERAKKEEIPYEIVNAKTCGGDEGVSNKLLSLMKEYQIDMIFLAGYMKKLPVAVLEQYDNRIFNIHPALLPKYGGKGMYGIHVHEAVIAAGEKESGVTIHRVNSQYDSGEIIRQATVPVIEGDTPDTLAARVLEREHLFLVEVISDIADGKVKLG